MNSGDQWVDRPRVWIVLVNWNGWRDTIECLESVFRLDYPDFRVVVCDNASTDGSVEYIQRWARGETPFESPQGPLSRLSWPPLGKPLKFDLISNVEEFDCLESGAPLLLANTGGNLGFAGGNNVGIRLALADPDCDFVWLLNNDTVVEADCLSQMIKTAGSDSSIGFTGSLNCYYSRPNTIQALGGGWFNQRRVKGGLHANELQRSDLTLSMVRQVKANLDWISGASMLVSRRCLECVGEMEERYFLYFEEIDWAIRSKGQFSNAVAVSALLYHKAGSSTGEGTESTFSTYTMYRSRCKLYRKLMPHWLFGCYLRAAQEVAMALMRWRLRRANTIFRACLDDFREAGPKGV